MASEPRLRAFITAVAFADGNVHLNALAVPDEVCAMTTTGVEAGRRFEGPSTGYAYAELSVEFLRQVLRAVEDRPSGAVVSLVQPDPEMRSVGQVAREFLEKQPQQWPLSRWQPTGCLVHPDARLQDGLCPICHPNGGAA